MSLCENGPICPFGIENPPTCYRAPRCPDPELPPKNAPQKRPSGPNSGASRKYPENTRTQQQWPAQWQQTQQWPPWEQYGYQGRHQLLSWKVKLDLRLPFQKIPKWAFLVFRGYFFGIFGVFWGYFAGVQSFGPRGIFSVFSMEIPGRAISGLCSRSGRSQFGYLLPMF